MFNSLDSRRRPPGGFVRLLKAYIGFAGDQGGGEPLQVSGGGYFSGALRAATAAFTGAISAVSPAFTGTATFVALTLSGLLDLGANGQIKFPSTQNPSADPNTLDDYEEGTWTATEAYASFVWTFGGQRYTKIGNLVRLQCNFTTNAVQASAVTMRLGGLPFNCTANGGTTTSWGYTDAGQNGSFLLASSTAYLDMYTAAGAGAQYQNFPGKTFTLNITYET